MLYFLGSLALIFLIAGVGLVTWVSRLKDGMQSWSVKHAEVSQRYLKERRRAEAFLAEKKRLQYQLDTLRSNHEKVLHKVHTGVHCSSDSIADKLRNMPQDS